VTEGMQNINLDDVKSCVGASIVTAKSSLRNFAIELSDGRGLSLEAVDDDGDPLIESKLVQARNLPALNEAVCSVDWSWIYGFAIKQISVADKIVRLHLDSIGPLNVSVGTWQGSPFLSFQPFRPAK
jgi:hypothetical protein